MESWWQSSLWVFSLLSGKFFVPCSSHEDVKKNEKNVFCLDCCVPICLHCRRHLHRAHRLLQIRRYVYQDVVQVEDCEKLFDCSFIQSYTTNNAKVMFLKQRPQSRPLKSPGTRCISCERNIQSPYHFCSLGCKVDYFVRYEGRLGPPGLSVEGEQMTPSGVLGGGACLRASSGSSGASGAGLALCNASNCTAATEGSVTRKKTRTRVAAAATAPLIVAGRSDTPRPSRKTPPSPSPRRKGAPTRSPFF